MTFWSFVAVVIVAVGIVETTKMTVQLIMKLPDIADACLAWIERRIEASIDKLTDMGIEG